MAAADLSHLLDDLRRQKTLLTPQELEHRLPPVMPTGVGPLDELLGGGLHEGRITEVVGPGATAVAAIVVAAATRGGRLAAWVDRPDTLDPRSAAASGIDLARLLWCRPTSRREALRSADVLLSSRSFGLVVLDLAGESPRSAAVPSPARVQGPRREDRGSGLSLVRWAEPGERPRTRRPDADPTGGSWLRLSRVAQDARAALVVLGGHADTFATVALRASSARPRFSGAGPGMLLDGIEVSVSLERSKGGFAPGRATDMLLLAPEA